jgi:hypothetical protein
LRIEALSYVNSRAEVKVENRKTSRSELGFSDGPMKACQEIHE